MEQWFHLADTTSDEQLIYAIATRECAHFDVPAINKSVYFDYLCTTFMTNTWCLLQGTGTREDEYWTKTVKIDFSSRLEQNNVRFTQLTWCSRGSTEVVRSTWHIIANTTKPIDMAVHTYSVSLCKITCVSFEGPKQQKKFRRLMLRRIKWNDETAGMKDDG